MADQLRIELAGQRRLLEEFPACSQVGIAYDWGFQDRSGVPLLLQVDSAGGFGMGAWQWLHKTLYRAWRSANSHQGAAYRQQNTHNRNEGKDMGGKRHIVRLIIFISLLFCLLSGSVIGCAKGQQPTRSLEEWDRSRREAGIGLSGGD